MTRRIATLILSAFLTAALLSGCWDKVEIDQRGFIGVVMIDMAPPGYLEKMDEQVENVPGIEKQGGEMIKVTYVFADARKIGGEGGGGGKEKGFVTLSSVAMSIPKTSGYVDSRISRRMFFGHTQVIVLGEKFMKNPEKMKQVLDYFDRSPRFNRTARVLIAEGEEASKLAEVNPKGEALMSRYLREIMQNEVTNGRIVEINFNQFISMMRKDGSGILPRAIIEKEEVKISGLGLIKDFKLVGYLSEYDSLFYNTMIGKRRGGREYINLGDITATFVTSNTSRRMQLLNKDVNNLEVGIHVNIEGSIADNGYFGDIFDAKMIRRLESEYNKMIEDSSKFVVKKLQKEFNVDALNIGEYLQKYHPGVWDKVDDKWDEIYPTVKITPIMDHRIRRIGETK